MAQPSVPSKLGLSVDTLSRERNLHQLHGP